MQFGPVFRAAAGRGPRASHVTRHSRLAVVPIDGQPERQELRS